jgi:predicted phosphodiesterase
MSSRFVFLTDSHHYPDAPKDYAAPKMLTRSRPIMEASVPAVNALRPDFIVHGGDLLCGGSSFELPRETYLQSIRDVAAVFAGFEAPAYYIPGNHDADAQQGSFVEFEKHFPIPQPLTVIEAAPRLRLALSHIYHQCNPIEESCGIWTDELDQALRRAAAQAGEQRCAMILVLHTWVLPNYEAGAGMVKNADRLLATVREHPAIVAVFTGHRHKNRIRTYRDFLVVDTACLIGFPMGFREIQLRDDGYLIARFHALDLPELIQASAARSSPEENNGWQGEIHDRETEILLPRLKEIWR